MAAQEDLLMRAGQIQGKISPVAPYFFKTLNFSLLLKEAIHMLLPCAAMTCENCLDRGSLNLPINPFKMSFQWADP